jgi:hypothetical protein
VCKHNYTSYRGKCEKCNIYDIVELAVLTALDKSVEELYGVEKNGWRDEDLKLIIPTIEKISEVIFERYGKEN